MQRHLRSHIVLEAHGPARLQLAVEVGQEGSDGQLDVTIDGKPLTLTEAVDVHGSSMRLADMPQGRIVIDYATTVAGRVSPAAPTDADSITYVRPSRYCESDTLQPFASAEFAGLEGADLLAAVRSWVNGRLQYDLGSTQPTDGAVATILRGRGVCRDYAHVVVALMRAHDVPARLVSVYAPGLSPMDFHAVAEVMVDGRWVVVDATGLAPRESLTRIATGRDAADTAFISTLNAPVDLLEMEVLATVDALPGEDVSALVELG